MIHKRVKNHHYDERTHALNDLCTYIPQLNGWSKPVTIGTFNCGSCLLAEEAELQELPMKLKLNPKLHTLNQAKECTFETPIGRTSTDLRPWTTSTAALEIGPVHKCWSIFRAWTLPNSKSSQWSIKIKSIAAICKTWSSIKFTTIYVVHFGGR